ncbi:MAG: hypothetical protein P4L90_12570 [Rhodopila sp.]|nr:hypothetical protein [Rhodopila sp.]
MLTDEDPLTLIHPLIADIRKVIPATQEAMADGQPAKLGDIETLMASLCGNTSGLTPEQGSQTLSELTALQGAVEALTEALASRGSG